MCLKKYCIFIKKKQLEIYVPKYFAVIWVKCQNFKRILKYSTNWNEKNVYDFFLINEIGLE